MISNAVIAVTLNCNAKCKMCDIWKNNIKNEVKPEFYKKLPKNLKDINVTGGEPFLRQDLPEIVRVMKKRCPQARILINTNGFLPNIIERQIPKMLAIDPNLAIRVSLDGWISRHDNIRGIKGGFKLARKSLAVMKKLGVKDLGIAFTLMTENIDDLMKLFWWSKKQSLEFSLTIASSSDIYFGKNKVNFRPQESKQLDQDFAKIVKDQYSRLSLRSWLRAWFNQKLYDYLKTNKRVLPCQAAEKWVYIDSLGRVYGCHLKSWKMGDLRKSNFKDIYNHQQSNTVRCKAKKCDDCWMVCSAKTSIKKNKLKVATQIIKKKFSIGFNHR